MAALTSQVLPHYVKEGMRFSKLSDFANGIGEKPTGPEMEVLKKLSKSSAAHEDRYDPWRDEAERALARLLLIEPKVRKELTTIVGVGSKAADTEPVIRILRNALTIISLADATSLFGVEKNNFRPELIVPVITALLDHKQPVVKRDTLDILRNEGVSKLDDVYAKLTFFCCETLDPELHLKAKELAMKGGEVRLRANLAEVLKQSQTNSRAATRASGMIKEIDQRKITQAQDLGELQMPSIV